MNFRWTLLALALLSGNAQSYQPSIEIIEQFDDVKLIAFINEADLKNYPLWQPSTEIPPLVIKDAITALRNQYETTKEDFSDVIISEIELREISHRKDYWHYLVKVKDSQNKESGIQVYVILMTGKVIPAIIETESYK